MNDLDTFYVTIDWQSADGSVKAPELRSTLARLEIWVGDDCVTLVEDGLTRSVRRSTIVSLYPLAEWIVFNWWRLQFDGRPSPITPRRDMRAHSMAFVGDGFCWPDLRAVPEGDLVRFRWTRQRGHVGWPLAFLSQGTAWSSLAQVVGVYESVVEAVLQRLHESGVRDTVLEKEWTALRALDEEEVDFCRAVARLGLDPLSEGVDLAREVDLAMEALGEHLALELLDAADLRELTTDIEWIRGTLEDLRVAQPEPLSVSLLEELRHVVRPVVQGRRLDEPPWLVGWDAARLARQVLALAPEDSLPGASPVGVTTSTVHDRGLVGTGLDFSLVLGHPMSLRSTRFAEARAIWHAASSQRSEPFLLTQSASTTQAIGRAFAAELLVPVAGLAAILGDIDASDDDIAQAADHFNAPERVVTHQLENQLWGGV